MDEQQYIATSRTPMLSPGERCALRTLAAAQKLLHPTQAAEMPSVSSIEAELARYVQEAYRPRHYG
jgi:hypothetical protein